LVAFTGPAAWEYSIKVRSYGLGWLLIVILSLFLRRPPSQSKAWIVVILAVFALNTSIFTGLIAFSLVAGWLWDEFCAKRLRQLSIPMIVLAVATIGTFLAALPPPDAAIGLAPKPIDLSTFRMLPAYFVDSLLPHTGIARSFLPSILIAAAIVYACFKAICTTASARVALASGWLSTLAFVVYKVGSKPWHQWHLFLLPFAAAMAFNQRSTINRAAVIIPAALAVAGFNCGVREYIYDWNTIYSSAKQTAKSIKAAGYSNLPVVVFPYDVKASLSGYLGYPVYDGLSKTPGSYVIWRGMQPPSGIESFVRACELARTSPDKKCLLTLDKPLSSQELKVLTATYKVNLDRMGAFISDPWSKQRMPTEENYFVYLVSPDQP
jgi:hypothetical protein